MSNRRGTNMRVAGLCGVVRLGEPRDNRGPSKSGLISILASLRAYDLPEVVNATSKLEVATKALRRFERENPDWQKLHRAELAARRRLSRIRDSEEDRLRREIKECRNMLFLEGVTPAVISRIERLLNWEE